MRIGFFTPHNRHDRTAFSGSAFYMYRGLQAALGSDLVWVGSRQPANRWMQRLGNRWFPSEPGVNQKAAQGVDAIIALVGSKFVDALQATGKPVIYVTDAVPQYLRDAYGRTITETQIETERRAVTSAFAVLYASDFMRNEAIRHFGEDLAGKVHAMPWGLNNDAAPTGYTDKPKSAPKLLFIGMDWERKGGPMMLEAFQQVRQRWPDSQLIVTGPSKHPAPTTEGIVYRGFLDKNNASDRQTMESDLANAHVMLFPTKAECLGMVVAEANSYSTPVLGSAVGGVPSVLKDGINGVLMPPDASAERFAEAIANVLNDREHYEALSRSSFDYYRANLTWEHWTEQVMSFLQENVSR